MTDYIKSIAAQIRRIPTPDAYHGRLGAEAFRSGIEAAAAFVEAMPAQVAVKPLVWVNAGDGWKKAAGLGCEYWAEVGADTSPQQADYEARILAAIDLTPTVVADSPALDPVSKTPTLDAMAMRAAAVERVRLSCAVLDAAGFAEFADRVIELIPVIEAITLPADAALAEAMRLPEVKALVGNNCNELTEADRAYLIAHLSYELEPVGKPPSWNQLAMEVIRLSNALAALKGGE